MTFLQNGVCQFHVVATEPGVDDQTFEFQTPGCVDQTEYHVLDPFDASQHMLILYNATLQDSIDLTTEYKASRPGLNNANTCRNYRHLGERHPHRHKRPMLRPEYVNRCEVRAWMVDHPSLPIRYIVMMYGIPTSNNVNYNGFNVPYHIAQNEPVLSTAALDRGTAAQRAVIRTRWRSTARRWCRRSTVVTLTQPTHISGNWRRRQPCPAFWPAITRRSRGPPQATAARTGCWTIRDERYYSYSPQFPPYATVVAAAFPGTDPATIIEYSSNTPVLVVSSNDAVTYENGKSIVQTAKDVTFYGGWGQHNRYFSPYWPTDNSVTFSGRSNWFAVEPIESFCGMYVSHGWQSTYEEYFAANTFGGTDYSHTAITFVGYTSEPGLSGVNDSKYAAYWATGRTSAEAAWGSSHSQYFLFVGDPLVTR